MHCAKQSLFCIYSDGSSAVGGQTVTKHPGSFCISILSGNDNAYGDICTYLMAQKSAQRQQSRGEGQHSLQKRNWVHVDIGSRGDRCLYFVLDAFHTANIVPSTISVTTSFVAVYLTFRRSPFYALGYAANDVVLIVLWVLASITDARYLSVVVCFAAFLINDIYGFLSWRKMKERQMTDDTKWKRQAR